MAHSRAMNTNEKFVTTRRVKEEEGEEEEKGEKTGSFK